MKERKNMAESIDKRYHREIGEVWAPMASAGLIIPFWRPVIHRPTFVIIGENHSDFVKGGGERAEKIARRLAESPPDKITDQDLHVFADGIRSMFRDASLNLGENWMGTNRCAIQTGPMGTKHLRSNHEFKECQKQMDAILRALINEVLPQNVLLAGTYASQLFYEGRRPLYQLQPYNHLSPGGASIRIIAIEHPSSSRPEHKASRTKRLKDHFDQATRDSSDSP